MASVFVYGSMIWGMFPTDPKISWEGHFSGFMIGVVLAFYFRKKGPKPTTKRISDENVFQRMEIWRRLLENRRANNQRTKQV
ncbi:MAG: rhomboid family intramembrane serine protease [Flavobacteriales bacterium]